MREYTLELKQVRQFEGGLELKCEPERPIKPITAIVSHLPLRSFTAGLYEGISRDILVVASRYTATGSQFRVENTPEIIDRYLPQIDCMVGYLGSEGASPGFEYIRQRMQQQGQYDVGLVACVHDDDFKKEFAAKRFLPITWTDCEQEVAALDRIAAEALQGRKYERAGELYI